MDGNSEDVRVLVADDEALIRYGFRVLLETAPGVTWVGEAADGVAAVRQCRALHPDVALLDVRMPVMDGLEATRHITADESQNTRVLMVTTFGEDDLVFAALRGGASGYVLKDTSPEDLLEAIRVVAAGESLLAPAVTTRLVREFVRRGPAPDPATVRPAATDLARLTERERQILLQVAAGRSNAEIAEHLTVTLHTVKTHVSRLLAKLEQRDRAQLVVLAYENGLVIPGQP